MRFVLFSTFLFIFGIGLGCAIGEWETRKKRGNWRPHKPSTDILRDYK